MKITKVDRIVKVGDVSIGEAFLYKGEVHIRTDGQYRRTSEDYPIFIISLLSGHENNVRENVQVELINSNIQIW